MKLGVRSDCLLKGIKETELKFILFVICQPICLFLCCGVLRFSTYPLNQTVPLPIVRAIVLMQLRANEAKANGLRPS